MYQEINGVKFKVSPNTYKKQQELTEGVLTSVAQSYNVFDEEGLRKIITREFGFASLISTLFKLKKLFSAPGNGLQKILRLLYAIGPISLVILYILSIGKRGQFLLNIFAAFMKSMSLVSGKANILSIVLKILIRFIKAVNGSVFSVLLIMILIPISAFFTAIGSMLILGDKEAQRILPPIKMKQYLRHLKNIFKNLANGLVDMIPFARPVVTFLGNVFKKIIMFFRSGASQAKQTIDRMRRESQTKNEAFSITQLILVPLGLFFMKVLKRLKLLGVFGLIFMVMMKFIPGLRGVLAKIPIINKLYPLMLSAGAALASRFKLNNIAKALKQKAQEFEQLKEAVSVMNVVGH